ncbi:MAG: hypothetical protein KDA42_15295, partial [Planctomycetales bacterium]|nr:hypothetical protein [Planctomycetales bacterium]
MAWHNSLRRLITSHGMAEGRTSKSRTNSHRRQRAAQFEPLEDRRVLATFTWQGDVSNDFSNADNWEEAAAPTAGTDHTLIFNTGTPGFNSFAPNNDIAGLTGITIEIVDNNAGFDFTIGGNAIGLAAAGITNGGSEVGVTSINTPLTLTADSQFDNNAGGLGILQAVDNGGNLLTINDGGGLTALFGAIGGAGGLTFASGTTQVAASNTYGGITTVLSGANAFVESNGGLGGTGQGTIVNDGGTLDFSAGVSYTDAEPLMLDGTLRAILNGPASFNGPITLTGDSNLSSGGGVNDVLTLNGVISGGDSITVLQGVHVLTAANTFSGSFRVDGGTALVNGSLSPSTDVSVASGATLGGTGDVQGPVNVQNGGTLSPGILSTVILTTGDLDLNSGSNFDIDITNPGANPGLDFDQIQVTGTVTIGAVTFNLSGSETPSNGDSYLIIDNDGADPVNLGAGAPAEGSVVGMLNGEELRINYHAGDGNDVALFNGLTNAIISANWLAFGEAGDGSADTFLIQHNGASVEVLINDDPTPVFSAPIATTGQIIIRGSSDDDTLTVNNSNGLVAPDIIFDADGVGADSGGGEDGGFPRPGGFDTLRLMGDTEADTIYNPGETNDAGGVFQVAGDVVQRVEFFGLEPVQVIGVGGTITVGAQLAGIGFPQAMNDANDINYTRSPNSQAGFFAGLDAGRVTVDAYESI